ncbi:ATP-dependent helicase [Actinomyces sp. Z5]|uniref:ATP-dependent DNA helicase n=1 Tax=Actinomyces sp. Z5 TaxID=2250216 RepID=UPI000DCB3F37|nr:ATP-dependent DNA helicase [Actinomyces sp. Z5]RAX22992.1 ATP-dependent helicase [Actinomyces sp. Z5]
MSAADLTPEALAERLGLPRPTAEQSEVIGYDLRPLLVVAGAGSGKTATMSQRVVHLVATGVVRTDQVLGLTFTRKATAELAERVSVRLAQLAESGVITGVDDSPEPTVATYDSFAGSLVREYGLYVGTDPDATLITEARKWQIVTDILERRTDPLPIDKLSTAVKTVLDADNALSTNLLSIEDAREQLTDLHELFSGLIGTKGLKTAFKGTTDATEAWLGALDAVKDFRDYKRRHGLVDFGDRLALACRIAKEVPDAVAAMRAQYPAVLLDEFQDTSVAQVQLLAALFAGQGVTAVGDPNQAIYGWRGASAGALDTFHDRFNPSGVQAVAGGGNPEVETPVLQLSTAWRNDSAVLAAANVVSKPLRNPDYQPGDALVRHVPVRELQERSAAGGLGAGQVLAAFLTDPPQEADAVADFMQERWRPDAELAVLCRARSQMVPVAEALEARGVPYEVAVSGGMLSIPEVADMRALLAVAADPERGDRLMRLLTGADIGAADLRALQGFARELARQRGRADGAGADARSGGGVARAGDTRAEGAESASGGGGSTELEEAALSEALEELARRDDAARAPGARRAGRPGRPTVSPAVAGLSEAGRQAAVRIARALRRVRGALALSLPDLVSVAEQALGLDVELAARVGNRMGRRGLDAFRAAAEQYAADVEVPTVSGFLELLDYAESEERGLEAPEVEPEPGAVQIMTVHGAKGLEWDHVAVIGLTETSFPSYRAKHVPADKRVRANGWMTSKREFPYPLRSDADQLPPFELGDIGVPLGEGVKLSNDEKSEIKELREQYRLALGRHLVAEERRITYVAVTRARHDVLLTGSHLVKTGDTLKPASRFLTELQQAGLLAEFGPGFIDAPKDAVNPVGVAQASWPVTHPAAPGSERAARIAVAEAVGRAMAAPTTASAGEALRGGHPTGEGAADGRVARWWEDARLLLAERDAAAAEAPTVRQPAHLAATRLADLRDDRDGFALDLRRPLPSQPQPAGRLGTVFHDAIAQRLNSRGTLFSLQDAGVPDTLADSDRKRVERWLKVAAEHPLLDGYELVTTEDSLELTLGDTTLRCRIDAIFQRPGSNHFLVVDWKTGHQRVPVDQLSVYVHAWAAKKQIPTDQIRAAYVYVADGGEVDELGEEAFLSLEEIRRSVDRQAQ